jgi:hypothetical protein
MLLLFSKIIILTFEYAKENPVPYCILGDVYTL